MLYFKGSNLICYKCIILGNPHEGRVCIHHKAQVTYRELGSYYFPTGRHQSSTQLLLFAALNKVQRSLWELQAFWPNKNTKFSANNNCHVIMQKNLWHKHIRHLLYFPPVDKTDPSRVYGINLLFQLINNSNWSMRLSIKIKNG